MKPGKNILKLGRIILLIIIGLMLVILLAGWLFLNFYPSVGKTPSKEMQATFAQKTEWFYDGQFHNENEFTVMTGEAQKASDRTTPKEIIPVVKNTDIERGEEGSLRVTWYGHSSTLVQLGNQNIFIDPVLSERSSPVGFAGPKRFSEVPLDLDDVPDIDVIFISHDHYDHLDYKTIKAIDGRVQHYTGRNPLKPNISLWGGLHFTDDHHSVYYTGDGGYNDVFSRVFERFGEVNLMLADAGQYDTGWATTHMNPAEAAQAAKDAHAKWFIPVHWGAFVLANHAWDEPPRLAVEAAEELDINIATPRIGESMDYEQIKQFTEHWWELI